MIQTNADGLGQRVVCLINGPDWPVYGLLEKSATLTMRKSQSRINLKAGRIS